ncbi:MAG TPA: hypothetical protein VHE55_02065 [Fimbriimonadaceae bacterium]|nr:hypothetical protein [Fimbriimonadaceae bacterium]
MIRSNLLRHARKLVTTVVVACAAMAPLSALAQVRGYLSNFDVWNFSGKTANDFELYLGGITPDMITSTFRGNFPNAQITNLGTGSLIHWTGSSVPDTGKAHFGVGVKGNAQPKPVTYSWTFNGAVIWSLPPAWQGWNFYGPRTDVIQNWSPDPIFVQRRYLVYSGSLQLEDLMRGSAIWNAGKIIDSAPVPVQPGGTLTFDFVPQDDPDAWYILMYDEFDASGRLIRTYLNAAQAGPAGNKAKSH